MKKLLTAFTVLLFTGLLNDCFAQSEPYVATYSSSFKIGNTAYSTKVLEMWKDWDDNTFDKHDYFADTVTMYLSDGIVVKGKKQAIEGAKMHRGGMTSAKSIVHAWVPLYSNDTKQDAVCIWGRETDTWPDGKVETKDIHEVWWFNKDGKVSVMRQWTSKFGQ